jgi:hypothetical protein
LKCLAIALLTVLLTGGTSAPAPVLLRYRYEPGQVLRHAAEISQRLRIQNARGSLGNLGLRSNYALELEQTVKSVGPGPAFEIQVSPKSVRVELQGPLAHSAATIAEKLRQTGFTIRIDDRGRIRSLAETQTDSESRRKLVGPLADALRQLTPTLPEGPQRPGGTWREASRLPIELPSGDKIDAVLTVDYFLRGYSLVQGRACAHLEMRLHVGVAGTLGQGAALVTATGQGFGQGAAYLDLERGHLVQTGLVLTTESRFQGSAVDVQQTSELEMRMALRP